MEEKVSYECQPDEIFVYGSNEAGIHGAGAAYAARLHYGAMWGHGDGLCGRAYGIPTKDRFLRVLTLPQIQYYVDEFIQFAHNNPDMKFFITEVGTGLAGFDHSEIAPMFQNLPDNCRVSPEWSEYVTYSVYPCKPE